MRRRPLLLSLLLTMIAVALLSGVPAFSYLPNFTSPGPQMDHWDFNAFPVTWNLNPSAGSNIDTSSGRTVADVMQASFNTWTGAPNAVIAVSRGADTTVSAEGSSPKDMNLICFVCSDTDFTKDSQTLAVSITTTATGPGQTSGARTASFAGQILKADILFNPNSNYTTDAGGACNLSTCQDLQTVATHEIGHFLGLDHSAVVRAVMFPAASSIQTLSYDDVAGLSLLYPKNPPDVATGTITGTVTLTNGNNVFGAHVYAESVTADQAFDGSIRKTPVGTLTRPDGTYTIQGLPADSYIITAEPLDGPVSNSDVSGYPKAFGQSAVQTSFTTRWH